MAYLIARRYLAQAAHRPRRPIRIQVSIPLEMLDRFLETQRMTGVPVSRLAYEILAAGADSLTNPMRGDDHDGDAPHQQGAA